MVSEGIPGGDCNHMAQRIVDRACKHNKLAASLLAKRFCGALHSTTRDRFLNHFKRACASGEYKTKVAIHDLSRKYSSGLPRLTRLKRRHMLEAGRRVRKSPAIAKEFAKAPQSAERHILEDRQIGDEQTAGRRPNGWK